MLFPKKVTDNRKKSPTRKIDKWVAEEVRIRDWMCIICSDNEIHEIHHVWHGGEKQLDEWRNGADRLVWLCKDCHHELHFWIKSLWYREFTKQYLKWLYQ